MTPHTRTIDHPHALDPLVEALAAAVGEAHVLTEHELRAPFERDFTGRYGGECAAVVRPADAMQVAEVLRICGEHRVGVVPQGGNTGVVGGGVPRSGEVLMSLTRLRSIGNVDEATGHVLVGAGTTLAALQVAAADAGWDMPLDLGARDSATVGGLAATDAGGAMALAHGTMRDRVVGLQAVLPDGTVVERLRGLSKDNAGYSWPSLLIGSEGTLGVITAVLVKLIPRRSRRVAALFAVPGAEAATELLIRLRRLVPSLEAADVFFDEGVTLAERVMDGLSVPLQLRAPCYVIIECASAVDPMEQLADAVEAADELIVDQAAADDTMGRRALWRLREALPEALVRGGVPVKVDIAVPLDAVPRFTREVRRVIEGAAPEAETILWGHLGDGNVHVNVLGAEHAEEAIEERVLRLATDLGGTVSAEHGVGISKAKHLGLVRSAEELALLRRIKVSLDPRGTMNPGVVLPASAPR